MVMIYMLVLCFLFGELHANDCNDFGCTCQGLANYYGLEVGVHYGCTPAWAQQWYKDNNCATNPHTQPPYAGCEIQICDDSTITVLRMSETKDYPWGDIVPCNGCCDSNFNKNVKDGTTVYVFAERLKTANQPTGLVDLISVTGLSCPTGYEIVEGCCHSNFNDGAKATQIAMCGKWSKYGPFIDHIEIHGSKDKKYKPTCREEDGWFLLAHDFNEDTKDKNGHMYTYVCFHRIGWGVSSQCFLPKTIDDTKDVCKKIVDETNASDGYPISEIVIEAATIPVSWNVFEWTPQAKVRGYERYPIGGPMNCPNQDNCNVQYTETIIHTSSWQLDSGVAVDASWEFEMSAGIPLIFEIETQFGIGMTVDIGIGVGGSEELEQSKSQTFACTERDYATTCTIYTTRGEYLVYAQATPIFHHMGQTVDCKEFVDTVSLEWWGQSDMGTEAAENIICEDNVNFAGCATATEDICRQEDAVRWNCPKTCNIWGWGPAPCAGGADCNFVEVPNTECPPPSALEPAVGQYLDCNEAVFTPTALCEAYHAFTLETAPTDWQIQNCPGQPDLNGEVFMHSIWQWSCIPSDDLSAKTEVETLQSVNRALKEALKVALN